MGYLSRSLSSEEFGLLVIFFTIIGFSSLLDGGIARAVIRSIAINRDDLVKVRSVIANSILLVIIISILLVIAVFLFNKNIIEMLNVSRILTGESEISLLVLSFAIPMLLITNVSLSYLEGIENFKLLSKYKAVNGVFFSLLPCFLVYIEPNLIYATVGLIFARFFSMLLGLFACRSILSVAAFKWNTAEIKEMMTFGGWLTVSNIVSPLMVISDRFFVSNSFGAGVAAYYISAAELVSKLSILPGALSRTIFPMLSRDSKNVNNIERKAFTILIVILTPMILVLYTFSKEIFELWLGAGYALRSSAVFNILLIGYFFSALSQIPATKIQALGHSKVTAVIHVCEVIPFFLVLTYCINTHGYIGAAFAWVLRVVVDFILLVIFSYTINKKSYNE